MHNICSYTWWNRAALRLLEKMEDAALDSPGRFHRSLRRLDEDKALQYGCWRARMSAWRAWHNVPAYRDFLGLNGLKAPDVPLEDLPVMSKDNYIRAYPTAHRCVSGTFQAPGVSIDESSGSTGTPYNWVRGLSERLRSRRELARMIGWVLGERPRIAINAFSMGAWATGVNVGEALELHGVVKSTGPDLEKILHTLRFFGPAPGYFICGYPPFLKLILDTMLQRGFPVSQYELHGLVGGEGMSEEFRQYLLRHFRSCYSGYGASDLEMGIAVETPETVLIRGLLHDHAGLRARVLKGDHRLPMIFQYNPMTHHLETNERHELIVTLNYSRILSPRIRYNIGDEAILFKRKDLMRLLRDAGQPVVLPGGRVLDLPYLFLFGRRDQTISIMGANVYPEDMERVLFLQPELAAGIASFRMTVEDRGHGAVYPSVCVEWLTEKAPALPLEILAERIRNDLIKLNADFRTAASEHPKALKLELQVYGFGTGPFAGRERRIKNRYLVNSKRQPPC